MRQRLWILVGLVLAAVRAADVDGIVSMSVERLDTPTIDPAAHPWMRDVEGDVRVTLGAWGTVAVSHVDGSFRFTGVPPGAYVLEVLHPYLLYQPVLVEISSRDSSKVSGFLFSLEKGRSLKLKYPLQLTPSMLLQFFSPRPSLNIMTLFKNPMVIMGIITLVAMVALPKLQESISAEEMQEMTGGEPESPAYKSAMVQKIFGG